MKEKTTMVVSLLLDTHIVHLPNNVSDFGKTNNVKKNSVPPMLLMKTLQPNISVMILNLNLKYKLKIVVFIPLDINGVLQPTNVLDFSKMNNVKSNSVPLTLKKLVL